MPAEDRAELIARYQRKTDDPVLQASLEAIISATNFWMGTRKMCPP